MTIPLYFKNRVRERVSSHGTGSFVLAGAIPGYFTFAAQVDPATPFMYVVKEGNSVEGGIGTFTLGSNSISRDEVWFSSAGGTTKITLAGTAVVWLDVLAEFYSIAGPPRSVVFAVSDPNGFAITTGDGKVYFRVPSTLNGHSLTAVAAAVDTPSSLATVQVGIRRRRNGVDAEMLLNSLSVDPNENDSSTAATPVIIDPANRDVATADRIYIDVNAAGTGAKGLTVSLTFSP